MPTSSSDEKHKVAMAMYDSFSKTVMRNLIGQERIRRNVLNENEVTGMEVLEHTSETNGKEDMYPSEFVVEDEHGHSCVVTLDWLYQAMLLLEKEQREVLILEFWDGVSVSDIAKSLEVSEKTIYNRKRKAFNSIRNYYEREKINGS